ncbi:hypothetical protein HOJ01_03765 [bacterium]|jgi:hypothetical protein|nr:hypothetical protein [bacterium]
MSKKTENTNQVSEQVSAAKSPNSNIEMAQSQDTAIQDTSYQTRRKIIQALGFTAAGSLLYQTLTKFFSLNSHATQQLTPDPEVPIPYKDFYLEPKDNLDFEKILPAEVDSGIVPAQTIQIPNSQTEPNLENCKPISLYKENGRINLNTLRKIMNN